VRFKIMTGLVRSDAFEFFPTREVGNRLDDLEAALKRARVVKALLVGGSGLYEAQLPQKGLAKAILPHPRGEPLKRYAQTVGDAGLPDKIVNTTRVLLAGGVAVRWYPDFTSQSVIVADAESPEGWAQCELVLPFAKLRDRPCIVLQGSEYKKLIVSWDKVLDAMFDLGEEPDV
jgi:hypothetical protein